MSLEQLEQLATAADRDDQAAAASDPAGPGAPGAPAPEPATSPNLGPIAMLLTTFRTIAGAVLGVHSLAVTLDDGNVARCAEVLAPVADKYGLDLANSFTGPEAAALMVAGPILWTAAQQLNHELKAKRAKPVPGEEVNPAEAGSESAGAPGIG